MPAPGAAGAYLGLGMANYFIGSLSETKKFFLGFAGIHGDKKAGISSSSGSPPSMATICGRLRRFCWRWQPYERKRQKWPVDNLRSSPRDFPKTRFLLAS